MGSQASKGDVAAEGNAAAAADAAAVKTNGQVGALNSSMVFLLWGEVGQRVTFLRPKPDLEPIHLTLNS